MQRTLVAVLLVLGSVWLCAPTLAADYPGTLSVERHYTLEELKQLGLELRQPSPDAVDPLAIYSDITNFSGSAFAQGASAAAGGGAFITRLVMDDLTFTTNPGVGLVSTIRFTVANLNAVAVSARVRMRFWNADGPPLGGGLPNAPGNYYAPTVPGGDLGFTFNPFSFGAGVTVLTGNVTDFSVPAGATTTLWTGISLDSADGAGGNTGATQAQMDNMGQAMFAPVDLGSSTDTVFETTAAGSFFSTDNPAGAAVNFGGSPVADMGWEFVVTALPVELQSFTIE